MLLVVVVVGGGALLYITLLSFAVFGLALLSRASPGLPAGLPTAWKYGHPSMVNEGVTPDLLFLLNINYPPRPLRGDSSL